MTFPHRENNKQRSSDANGRDRAQRPQHELDLLRSLLAPSGRPATAIAADNSSSSSLPFYDEFLAGILEEASAIAEDSLKLLESSQILDNSESSSRSSQRHY